MTHEEPTNKDFFEAHEDEWREEQKVLSKIAKEAAEEGTDEYIEHLGRQQQKAYSTST